MTPPFIPPLGILINTGNPYARKATPAWIAKRLRRHAGAPARVKARQEAIKKRQEDVENFRRHLEREKAELREAKLREVASLYPISLAQVSRIARGESYPSVTQPTPSPSNPKLRNADLKR